MNETKISILIIISMMLLTPITYAATAGSSSASSTDGGSAVQVSNSSPSLSITTDTQTVYVGELITVVFTVNAESSCNPSPGGSCATSATSVPLSGTYIQLSGAATGGGTTDQYGEVIISVNANYAGTITAIASKSGYSDGSIVITAKMPPTQPPPTPSSQPSVTFISDKNSYVRDSLIYLTMKNDGDQSIILSDSNSVHWWIENIIYTSDATSAAETTSDTSDSSAIATSDSAVSNTQLFPGGSITVPWDQRDSSKNMVSQGKYRACVRWSYSDQYYQSCTKSFDIIVQDTPTPSPVTYSPTPPITYNPAPPPIVDTPKPSPSVTKKKDNFRTGPTVNLRPVKDEISKSEDGLIELYMDNPSLNDIVMYADVRISVPSGINVYGQGFGDAGSAGVLHGTFDISPGKSRTIQMTVKAEKTGEFLIKFSGTYWPGNNKDAFQPISLTHSFKVHDISTPIIIPTITTKDDKDNSIGILEIYRTFIKSISDFLDNVFGPTGYVSRMQEK